MPPKKKKKKGGGRSKRASHSYLKRIFTDLKHPAAFSSPYKLYKAAKKDGKDITLREVEEWLESQKSYTLYRDIKTKFYRRKVLARGIRYQYQADLVDYSALKRDNSGFTFLLTVIDCFSRFALALPIKSKQALHVLEGLEKAFAEMGKPLKFQTDQGKEFYNKHVSAYLSKSKVHHFSTDQELKAQIVERFNRTLREALKKSMAERKSLRYVDVLPDFLYGYNHRPHSSIYPYSPAEVNEKNEKKVYEIQYREYLDSRKARHRYQIGDRVRIAAYKGAFRKSYKEKNFTEEIFEIVDTLHTNPPTYRLKDLSGELLTGAFYEQQLQRVRGDHNG